MAYNLFSEGADSGWNKLSYKIEYETTRDGPRVGIRWKIRYTIANQYYFGYNINSAVWTKGSNYGRIIKYNSPNKGSGEALFPEDGGYYWFDNGYTDNSITGCRIVINSTNGGGINYDTRTDGTDRTVYAPTGFLASNITSSTNFNIGNDLKVVIKDITNIDYTYLMYLDVMKSDGTWQTVSNVTTTDKIYTWNLSSLASTLYSLLSTRNSAETKISIITRYGGTDIGTIVKNGVVYVTNSNPDAPLATLSSSNGTLSVISEINVVAGFGPYSDNSTIFVAVKDTSLVAKNEATLEKIIVEWNGIKETYNVSDIIGGS